MHGSHYERFAQLIYTIIGLEVFDDGPIFSGIARRQEIGSFVFRHRRTEESKAKRYGFVCEILVFLIISSLGITTVFLLCTGNIALGHRTNVTSLVGT